MPKSKSENYHIKKDELRRKSLSGGGKKDFLKYKLSFEEITVAPQLKKNGECKKMSKCGKLCVTSFPKSWL